MKEEVRDAVDSGREHEVLLDRREELLRPRRSRDTQLERKTLTRRVRLGTPRSGRGLRMLTWRSVVLAPLRPLTHGGHGISDEVFVDRSGLNVWCYDDSVLP